MRLSIVSIVIVSAALTMTAGCVETTNEDPFAYTREPLMTGSWDLAGGVNESREFHVNDGSIVRMRIEVGGEEPDPFRLGFENPSGQTVLVMEETGIRHVRFAPGTWTAHVQAPADASGRLYVQVVRG